MSEGAGFDPPSSFVALWLPELARLVPPRRRALDLAMGRGRHSRPLADAGFRVFGVDVQLNVLQAAVLMARSRRVRVAAWCADLRSYPLPIAAFDLVVVTRYLQRDLFPAIRDSISSGGAVLYETFTEQQRTLGRGPTSSDHLLRPGELRRYFDGFEVLACEEVVGTEAVARLVARKRSGAA